MTQRMKEKKFVRESEFDESLNQLLTSFSLQAEKCRKVWHREKYRMRSSATGRRGLTRQGAWKALLCPLRGFHSFSCTEKFHVSIPSYDAALLWEFLHIFLCGPYMFVIFLMVKTIPIELRVRWDMLFGMRSDEACVQRYEDICKALETNTECGLNASDVEERQRIHGANEFEIKEETPLWKKYLEQVWVRSTCCHHVLDLSVDWLIVSFLFFNSSKRHSSLCSWSRRPSVLFRNNTMTPSALLLP